MNGMAITEDGGALDVTMWDVYTSPLASLSTQEPGRGSPSCLIWFIAFAASKLRSFPAVCGVQCNTVVVVHL